MTHRESKRVVYRRFLESWSLSLNDYEAARELGVDVATLRAVKKDLCSDFPSSPQGRPCNMYKPDRGV